MSTLTANWHFRGLHMWEPQHTQLKCEQHSTQRSSQRPSCFERKWLYGGKNMRRRLSHHAKRLSLNSSAGTSRRSSPSLSPTTKEQFISQLTGPSNKKREEGDDRPQVLGLHHLKFAVSNLDVSIVWYERVLGARRIASLDHSRPDGTRFAIVCQITDWSGAYLELRHCESQALKDRGWDPVTLSVRTRQDLYHWVEWLDRWGTTHSPVLTGPRGWILVFEDPDGRRMRVYTQEDHGGTEPTSIGDDWLNEP